MKRPQPDIGDTLRASYIGSLGGCRKLRRLWGTEVVEGTEVLSRKKYYYPDSKRSENYEKLFRFLGVYEDVKDANPEGVKNAWFYFNKNKGPEEANVSNSFISDNLNRLWWDPNDGEMPEGLTLTTSLVIDADVTSSKVSDLLDHSDTKTVQMQAVIDNYEALWSTCTITQQGIGVINKGTVLDTELNIEVPDEDDLVPEDPWLDTLTRYALLDDGVPCTVKNIEVGLSQKLRNKVATFVVTLEIPYKQFYTNSRVVERIAEDLSTPDISEYSSARVRALQNKNNIRFLGNPSATRQAIKGMAFNSDEDDLDTALLTRDYLLWEDQGLQDSIYEDMWVKLKGNWYIKADVFDNPKVYGITYKKLHTYLFTVIDTGYKKKKAKWYKKVIAVIVFIVVAVVTYLSAGATSPLLNAATALVVASFALSLAALAFSAMGMESMALAFSEINKAVEPLVTIASVILIVNSVITFAQQAMKQGLGETLKAIVGDLLGDFAQGVADILSGALHTAPAMGAMTTIIKAYTLPQQIQLGKLAERNKDLKAEYDKFMEENSRESDALQGFMRVYSSPATGDWSWYSGLYDMPYERGGGTMAMGNIQKTTKQALRKADYDMPVFENIRLV